MNPTRALRSAALLLGPLALVLAGCGGPRGPKVAGLVTMDDRPLGHARIEFESSDDNLRSSNFAESDENGRYEIKPHPVTGWTLKPGSYRVFVTKFVDRSGNVPQDEDRAATDGSTFNVVPEVYSDREENRLTVNVESGENDLPIRLSSRARRSSADAP